MFASLARFGALIDLVIDILSDRLRFRIGALFREFHGLYTVLLGLAACMQIGLCALSLKHGELTPAASPEVDVGEREVLALAQLRCAAVFVTEGARVAVERLSDPAAVV